MIRFSLPTDSATAGWRVAQATYRRWSVERRCGIALLTWMERRAA